MLWYLHEWKVGCKSPLYCREHHHHLSHPRRPYLFIRIGKRHIKLETYFIGSLLGPVLIITFGLLNYGQIIRGLNGDGGAESARYPCALPLHGFYKHITGHHLIFRVLCTSRS